MQLVEAARDRSAPKTFRLPLDHPETELIDQRIHALLDRGRLNDQEFGQLVKLTKSLKRADRFLARVLYGRPLPRTSIRPLFWDDAFHRLHHVGGLPVEAIAGWVWRVAEYVERIERKYGVAAPAMEPGDDI